MNDVSSREEEFYPRYERFKARMRELRGLRVNQYLGLLDPNQQRKVQLIEKEVEEFVRKFAYGGGLSPLIQESILVTFNSDVVMRKRIELRGPGAGGVAGRATLEARANRGVEERAPSSAGRPDNGNGNGSRSTPAFIPTPDEISRQASRLMGGKRVSSRSISVLQEAIARKLQANGNGNGGGQCPVQARQVRLALTDSGKVTILID
jgi:hypothetical protein